MNDYLNLNIPAKRRLAILKNSAAELNAGHNLRKSQNDMRPYTWLDVRYSGFHNARANRCELSPGFNDNGQTVIWYCHTGPYFPRERFADECNGGPDHCGWYADSEGYNVIHGVVVALPHGRYLAGYYQSDNGERVYYPDIFDDERAAARFADSKAKSLAESEREYNERYHAARDIEDNLQRYVERLRECLALRNNPCFARVRNEIAGLVKNIRSTRKTLKTEYAGVL